MKVHPFASVLPLAAAAALVLAACSSAPKPPTVDDSKRRPVNVSEALNLQMCRTELSAAKVVLTETLATTSPGRGSMRPAGGSFEPTADASRVAVIQFAVASAEVQLPAEQRARLAELARGARYIVIRGRTDATVDSAVETRLAQRRAEAARVFVASLVRLPPDDIRVSWQGAGDRIQPGGAAADRQVNRRVEIELYPARPTVEVLTATAS